MNLGISHAPQTRSSLHALDSNTSKHELLLQLLKPFLFGRIIHHHYMFRARKRGYKSCPTFRVRSYSSIYRFERITPVRSCSINSFRDEFFKPELPGFLPNEIFSFKEIPALTKWFTSSKCSLNLNYLNKYADKLIVPLELTRFQRNDENHIAEEFERFNAPLRLFLDSLRLREQDEAHENSQKLNLYLAQASISDFPPALQDDMPVPSLVLEAGKGDIYNANIWMGLPPTNTPLHCDSNPNLFIQLAGRKKVRLFSPSDGSSIYGKVRKLSGKSYTSDITRDDDMMHGVEKKLLDEFVWTDKPSDIAVDQLRGTETELGPGDGLFIPQRWWHSIKSAGTSFNASVRSTLLVWLFENQIANDTKQVNWWFR